MSASRMNRFGVTEQEMAFPMIALGDVSVDRVQYAAGELFDAMEPGNVRTLLDRGAAKSTSDVDAPTQGVSGDTTAAAQASASTGKSNAEAKSSGADQGTSKTAKQG